MIDQPQSPWPTAYFEAVITLTVAIFIYWLGKRSGKRAISYEHWSARIASKSGPYGDKLKIIFDGRAVENVSVVEVTIRNSGRSPIQGKDFEGPLRVALECRDTILAVSLRKKTPEDLTVMFNLLLESESSKTISIDPLLLNPADEFTLEALVSGFDKNVTVGGRISGVAAFKDLTWKYPENVNTPQRTFRYGFAFLTTLLVMVKGVNYLVGVPSFWFAQHAFLAYFTLLALWGSGCAIYMSKTSS